MSAVLNIFIIDDHPVFRDGMAMSLRHLHPDAIFHSAGTGEEALAKLETLHDLDWIFLDIVLPGAYSGLDLIKEFSKRKNVLASIIAISSDDSAEMLHRVFAAGANGFLSKISELSEFQQCMTCIESGRNYLNPSLKKGLQHYNEVVLQEKSKMRAQLSERQFQVLTLLSKGYSNSEIAKVLSLSESTVKTHVSNVMDILCADNRTHCVSEAQRLQILA